MQVSIAWQPARVSPFAAAAINGAPAFARARQPREPRGLAIALEIHDERKFSRAQISQQPEKFRRGAQGIFQRRAIKGDHFIHVKKPLQQGRIFSHCKKNNVGIGKIFADGMDGRQSQNHVADGLEPDEQNVFLRLHVCAARADSTAATSAERNAPREQFLA